MIMQENLINIYLDTLFMNVADNDLIELRPISSKGVKQHFIFKNNKDLIIEKIKNYENEYNIFIGILPRDNKNGKDSSITKVTTLWADIDAKDFGGEKSEALKQLENFELKPTMLIDSGNGYHAYWILNKPFIIESKSDRKYIKKISKLIHKTVNADSTHNLSRILRVPGTRNIKDKNNPIYCKIENINYEFYSIKQIENSIPTIIKENYEQTEAIDIQLRGKTKYTTLEELEKIMGTEFISRAKKIPAKLQGDRSGNDFWLAREMYEAGLSDVDVIYAFKLFAKNNWEGGSKFKENGLSYL